MENRRKYIDWLVKKVGVSDPSQLKASDLEQNLGRRLLLLFGYSLPRVLESLKSEARKSKVTNSIRVYYTWVLPPFSLYSLFFVFLC